MIYPRKVTRKPSALRIGVSVVVCMIILGVIIGSLLSQLPDRPTIDFNDFY